MNSVVTASRCLKPGTLNSSPESHAQYEEALRKGYDDYWGKAPCYPSGLLGMPLGFQ